MYASFATEGNDIIVNRIKTFKPIDMLMSAMIHYEKISHVKHDDGKKTLLCLTESRWMVQIGGRQMILSAPELLH
ncbi:hypothetical protein P364_0113320 [Paenibacillus sp. MAEPY2]|nr:hypothetical protein P364_0113320 [Paenibacillus sp. MAEPY2]KGP89059.1 hypothetical protein P363_0101665 [Paenibacillus sp. MAEPY1]